MRCTLFFIDLSLLMVETHTISLPLLALHRNLGPSGTTRMIESGARFRQQSMPGFDMVYRLKKMRRRLPWSATSGQSTWQGALQLTRLQALRKTTSRLQNTT